MDLSSKDIVKIIRESSKSGVTRLSWHGLEVDFKARKSAWTEIPSLPLVEQQFPIRQLEKQHIEQDVVAKQAMVERNIAIMQEEIDQLHILEPHEAEELICKEELEDGGEEEEHRGSEQSL